MSGRPAFAVCVPTLNPGPGFTQWLARTLPALQGAPLLVIDSSSEDDTVRLARDAGAEVAVIERHQFNHGGTRSWAIRHLSDVDVVVFLTQDALPCGPDALVDLVSGFQDPGLGAAFGRQLPHDDASPVAAHARLFNYGAVSRTVGPENIPEFGLKAAFLSNSFAAYRREALLGVGGFAEDVILSEDMLAGARLLQAGWKLAYCAEACVQHSHNYSMTEEFRRYFDIGVFHAHEAWLRAWLGSAEGEGVRFVRSEAAFLLRRAPWRLPEAALRTWLKYAGYRLGTQSRRLPRRWNRRLSMHRRYWSSR